MQTPIAPGAQPLPCACHTAWRMHLRTPSIDRSARPRCGSSAGSEYCEFMFSQPPPLRISFTSISSSFSHCSKWMIGVPGPEVVAGVLAGQRIHRVRAQLAAPGGLGDRRADLLLHHDLVGAHRRLDLEGGHAGVLADGALAFRGLVDVLRDDGQRLRGTGARLLLFHGRFHGGAHVRAAGPWTCGRPATGRSRRRRKA